MENTTDAALALLRIAFGLMILAHGADRAFAGVSGRGFAKAVENLRTHHFRPARLWAVALTTSELVGGPLLVLGLMTPLAAAAVAANWFVITVTVWPRGFWPAQGGWEFPSLALIVAIALGLAGGGQYSLDAALGLRDALGPQVFVIALALTVASAVLSLVARGPAAPATESSAVRR